MAVPFGTEVTNLVPMISFSDKSTVNPNSEVAQDFTNSIIYTVTAEDNSIQEYTVSVVVGADPSPTPDPILGCMDSSFDNYDSTATEDTDPTLCVNDPDPIPDPVVDIITPSITSYSLNGISGDITVNPLSNPMVINLNSSEDVNWMSVKIENQDNSSFYKIFQSGAGCVDGTNTCTKTWDGLLSSGGLLDSGTYKIKVHIKDAADNEYYDYLPSIITVEIPI